jgi:hypothetical protein
MKPARNTLILWAFLVLTFLATWQFLQGDDGSRSLALSKSVTLWELFTLAMVVVVLGFALVRGHLVTKRQFWAIALLSHGRESEAEAELERLSKSQLVLVRASALSWLAVLAERRADFKRALELCDAGLASLPARYRPQAADVLFPGLLAQRASVLAALDRAAEGESELAAMRQHYPWYFATTKAIFATRLRALARAGDVAAAATLAASRSPLLPLSAEEELLADVAMCAAGSPGAMTPAEIRERLDGWSEGSNFIVRLAPKLWEAFLRVRR